MKKKLFLTLLITAFNLQCKNDNKDILDRLDRIEEKLTKLEKTQCKCPMMGKKSDMDMGMMMGSTEGMMPKKKGIN